jgi:hypothetical protein
MEQPTSTWVRFTLTIPGQNYIDAHKQLGCDLAERLWLARQLGQIVAI